MEGKTADTTFGERVRDARIERNLSQEGLASLCPPFTRAGKTTRRSSTWVSNIETGKNEPSLADLTAIADALQVPVAWLVTGAESGDSEFIARVRGAQVFLDERGQRAVLATLDREVEESKKRAVAQNEAELEMLRAFRAVSPEQRDLLLAAALRAEAQRAGQPSERQEGQNRQERTA